MKHDHALGPRAFGGGPLVGSKLVRIAFLDEGGVSRARDEPVAVVAGVVVHGDGDFLKLEHALEQIVAAFPDTHVKERYVHTAKLYGGTGPFHKSKGWDEEARFETLNGVAALFKSYMPLVVWGHCPKNEYDEEDPLTRAAYPDRNQFAHLMAAAQCSMQIERLMREYHADEVCLMVMENTDYVRKLLKQQHRILANPPPGLVTERNKGWLPLTKIRGTPQFEEKGDASLLQLADFCCFVIKRRLMRDKKIDPLYHAIRDTITYMYHDPAHPLGQYDFAERYGAVGRTKE